MEKYPYWRVLIGFPLVTQLLVALLLFIFFTDLSRQQINDIHIIFFHQYLRSNLGNRTHFFTGDGVLFGKFSA